MGGVLVERDREVATLERQLADARDEVGNVTLIEAPSGKGKSRLLNIAGDLARRTDMLVLGAKPTELERDFPFGVAIQLFEPRWVSADEPTREQLLGGPTRLAGELLQGRLSAGRDQAYAVTHALFRLLAHLTGSPDELDFTPVAMLVDDAQWADPPSLRFLAYAAERLEALPVALVVAVRAGEPTTDPAALRALRRAADAGVLRPGSLSSEGVAAIVRSRFPEAERHFCAACARITHGNPFLLTRLLDQLEHDGRRADAKTAAELAEMAPESVLESVVARLAAMPPDARSVASAVAVLGEGAGLARVAALSGLEVERVARAADALTAAYFFCPGSPLAFMHPLIASAVKASMAPHDRDRAHRRAASIVADDGAPPEEAAGHLLACQPDADPRAVEVLRSAARTALASGAADSAVRMLERALAESPAPEALPAILGELGEAEAAAGLPQAIDRLHDALRATDEKPRRAELGLAQSSALREQGRHREAADVIASALEDVAAHTAVHAELDAAYVAAALYVPELAESARARGERMVARLTDALTGPERVAVAHLAMHHGLRGAPRELVRELALRAWGDGALLAAEADGGAAWPLVTSALLFADELELDLAVCEAARERGSTAHAAESYCRMWALYEQGRIAEAAAAAQAALDARADGAESYPRPAYGAIACCHLERGRLDHAETALSIIEHPGVGESADVPFLLEVRARLRLAQLRPAEALEDAIEAGRRLESPVSPGALAWRSTAALAHLALGGPAPARELAAAELGEARRFRITRVVIRNLRILGLAERGKRGLDLLAEAVSTGAEHPPRLEYIHALVDLGGALRRSNQRAAARDPLRKALELSHGGGAVALSERARAELTATGARPRREMLSGRESLTPSERRVGELAARGLTTRQIAELLFVSPKTIEFHLRHIYRKLDVSSRAELADVLGDD